MTQTARLLNDSINEYGNRLTSFQLRYPWIIHSEGQTHRALSLSEDEFDGWSPKTPTLMADRNLSRNAGSTRAIPVARMIQSVLDDPFVPMFWGANQKGMQAGAECNELVNCSRFSDAFRSIMGREDAWKLAMENAIESAKAFDAAGYHKQIVNRLLAPFSHIDVVMSGTEWNNFFALRLDKAAEPHIRDLAQKMKAAMDASTPKLRKPGEGHYCYITDDDWLAIYSGGGILNKHEFSLYLAQIDAARCAAVSYKPFEGTGDHQKEMARYNMLVGSSPVHASPTEHQATPDYIGHCSGEFVWSQQHGNFKGWRQHRKMIPNECVPG